MQRMWIQKYIQIKPLKESCFLLGEIKLIVIKMRRAGRYISDQLAGLFV